MTIYSDTIRPMSEPTISGLWVSLGRGGGPLPKIGGHQRTHPKGQPAAMVWSFLAFQWETIGNQSEKSQKQEISCLILENTGLVNGENKCFTAVIFSFLDFPAFRSLWLESHTWYDAHFFWHCQEFSQCHLFVPPAAWPFRRKAWKNTQTTLEGFMDFQGTIYNMYPWKKGIFTIIYLRDWLIFNGKISRKFIPVPCVLWCQMLPTNYHKLPTFNPKFAKATGSRQSGLTQQRQSLDFWSRCRATGSGVVIWSRVLFIRRYGWNDWKQLNQYLIYNYKTIYIYILNRNQYVYT